MRRCFSRLRTAFSLSFAPCGVITSLESLCAVTVGSARGGAVMSSTLWLAPMRRFLRRCPSSGAALAFYDEFWTLAAPCFRVWASLLPACLLAILA